MAATRGMIGACADVVGGDAGRYVWRPYQTRPFTEGLAAALMWSPMGMRLLSCARLLMERTLNTV